MALSLEVDQGDTVRIGTSVVKIERKSGGRVRLRIESEYRVAVEKDAPRLQRPQKVGEEPSRVKRPG